MRTAVGLSWLYTNVNHYVDGLNRLLGLDFDALVPSHGDPLDAAAGRRRISESIEWVSDVDTFTRSSSASAVPSQSVNWPGSSAPSWATSAGFACRRSRWPVPTSKYCPASSSPNPAGT